MQADPSTRESLKAEAEVDPMEGEQTWPTESELLEAEGADADFRFRAFMCLMKKKNPSLATGCIYLNHNSEDLFRKCLFFPFQRPGRKNES